MLVTVLLFVLGLVLLIAGSELLVRGASRLAAALGVSPLVVGLTTSPDRLIQIRRNRLLSLGQAPETEYVDSEAVMTELAFARRMFADNGWPVIDVTRRSIEESAAAIIKLLNDRTEAAGDGP